jgi:hypothetical protein
MSITLKRLQVGMPQLAKHLESQQVTSDTVLSPELLSELVTDGMDPAALRQLKALQTKLSPVDTPRVRPRADANMSASAASDLSAAITTKPSSTNPSSTEPTLTPLQRAQAMLLQHEGARSDPTTPPLGKPHIDWGTGARVLQEFEGLQSQPMILVTKDGCILQVQEDNTVKVLDQDGTCRHTLFGHARLITCLRELPNGIILTGSTDHTAKLWARDGTCIATLSGHKGAITSASVLPNGNVVTLARDATPKVWNQKGQCIATITPPVTTIPDITVLSNGHFLTKYAQRPVSVFDGQGNHLATLDGTKANHGRACWQTVTSPPDLST